MEQPLRPLRVLVADDNRATANTFGKLLERHGYDVRVILNGLAAMDVVHEFHPNIVLLDLSMPGLDGYEVTRRIRSEPDGDQTLIVIISGYAAPEDKASSMLAGADCHLAKPVDFAELTGIVTRWRDARAMS